MADYSVDSMDKRKAVAKDEKWAESDDIKWSMSNGWKSKIA